MKQRKLVIGLLIMVALVVSTFTFAFWGAAQDWDEEIASGNVKIGSARTVTVTASALSGAPTDFLVPVGKENQSNQNAAASSVTLTFNVDWDDSADYATTSVLNVSFSNYSFGNALTHAEIDRMFNVLDVSSTTDITNGTIKVVTIEVTFELEPLDATEYGLVANGNLTFDITFTVVTVNNPA
jgi:hypothetical protein